MKNLKKIITNGYDTRKYTDTQPYGVQSVELVACELYTADGYDWILANQYGTPITTNYTDDFEGNLGEDYEEIIKMIAEVIAWAKTNGSEEEPTAEELREICDLLGEKPDGLRDCRRYAGMTQKELSAASGIRQSRISEYESGRNDIKKAMIDTVKKLADALGCTIEQVAGV